MKPKLRVNTYVSKPGYQKFVTRYDHKLEGYDQIVKFAPIYLDNLEDPQYEKKELSDDEMQQCLMDFVSISRLINLDTSSSDSVIFEFLNKWGSLTNAEDLGITDNDEAATDMSLSQFFWTESNFYHFSNDMREVIDLENKGKLKSARENYIDSIHSHVTTDILFEEVDNRLAAVIEPRNLYEGLKYQFVTSLENSNPIRICPVCNKFYQRRITAKQCSDKCKSLKSVRKFRSKK